MTKESDSHLLSETVYRMRYPLMLLIVLLHTNDAVQNGMPQWGKSAAMYFVTNGLARIAVPFFFIFSGYYFFYRLPQNGFDFNTYRDKLSCRVHTLLIPYLIWNFFAWILQMAVGHFHGLSINTFRSLQMLDIFVGWQGGYGGMPKAFQLWFVRELMVLCVLSPLLYRCLSKKKYILWLPCFLLLYLLPYPAHWPLIFSKFPLALFFFSVGACCSIQGTNMLSYTKRISVIPCVILVIVTLAAYSFCRMRYLLSEQQLIKYCPLLLILPIGKLCVWLVKNNRLQMPSFFFSSTFLLYATHPLIINYLLTQPLQGRLTASVLNFWLYYGAELAVPALVCAGFTLLGKRLFPRTLSVLTGNHS